MKLINPLKHILIGIACFGFISVTQASVVINVGSAGYTASLSNNSPLPAGFSFALGSFGPLFNPTLGNASEWQSEFTTLGSDTWTAFDDFTFSGEVPDLNPPPFTTGAAAYIWGYNSQAAEAGSEWVLFTNPNWTWPASPVGPGVSVIWTLSDSGPTSAIIGSINNTANSFQTAAIPEPTTMALFAASLTAVMILRRRRHS